MTWVRAFKPSNYASTYRDDLRFVFQKTKALNASRYDVMSHLGCRSVAEVMRHEEAPVVNRLLLFPRCSQIFAARF